MKSSYLTRKTLPDVPGVYFFLGPPKRSGDKKGNILYIGKATSLRDRTKSYFAADLIKTRGPGIVDMIFRAEDIRWEETDTVLEALILEASLIKKYQPYYNTQERDDKSFLCVGITREAFPQLLTIRKKDINFKEKTALIARGKTKVRLQAIYGPFTSGGALNKAMKIIRRIFPYRDISSSKRDNYEFYKQIGLAPDLPRGHTQTVRRPSQNEIQVKKEYAKTIKNIKLFFEGKKKQIIRLLEKEMHGYSKKQEFEKADEVKRRLFAITHINDIALVKRDDWSEQPGVRPYRIEAYDVAHIGGASMVGVMVVVRNQTPHKAGYRMFKIKNFDSANDPGALREILMRRFKHPEWEFPDLVAVDGNEVQKRVAEDILYENNLPIPVVAVVKNVRHKPEAIIGTDDTVSRHKIAILLANAEAHRFAIAFHKKRRGKVFLT